jgi:hypothetical protein
MTGRLGTCAADGRIRNCRPSGDTHGNGRGSWILDATEEDDYFANALGVLFYNSSDK